MEAGGIKEGEMGIPDVFLAKRIDKELEGVCEAEKLVKLKQGLANMLLLLALADENMVKQAIAALRITGLRSQQDWDDKLGG